MSGGLLWDMTENLGVAFNAALTKRHPNATELYADGPHLAVQRYEHGTVVRGLGEIDELPVYEYGQADVGLYGFEAEWLIDLMETNNGHFHACLFSDFIYGEEKNGKYLPRIPPLRFGAGVHYTSDSWDTSIDGTWFAKQDNVAENELPTDDYMIWNAEVSYRLAEPDLLLFIRGTNLGDEDARRHSSPLKDIAPLPGRSVHLGARWDF